MRNFNEIFKKGMTYDNLKSHKRSGLHAFFAKIKGGGGSN